MYRVSAKLLASSSSRTRAVGTDRVGASLAPMSLCLGPRSDLVPIGKAICLSVIVVCIRGSSEGSAPLVGGSG